MSAEMQFDNNSDNVDNDSCVLKSVRLHSVVLDGPLCIRALSVSAEERGSSTDNSCISNVACDDRLILLKLRDKLTDILIGNRVGVYRINSTNLIISEEGLVGKKLPKELLLRVFSFLDIVSLCRCAQVCRAWNVLALDGSNWQRVDLFQFQKDIKGPVVENLAKRCGGFLKVLSLRGCESVQDGALEIFAKKCSFIEELNLEKCKRLTDRTCLSLGTHCKRLRILNLDCVSLLTDDCLKAISDGCPHLQSLHISWCNRIQDNGLAAIANGCSELQTLICKGCTQITDEGVRHIALHCHDLRVLNFRSCQYVTDLSAQYISDGCHQLEYLCLSMCVQITDRTVQYLSYGCQLLKDLEVAGCNQLTDSGFNAFSKNCHDLERLDLEDCNLLTDHTLGFLATGCPNLVELSLSHCELITDEGIRQLSLGLCMNDRLRILELDNCPLITDSALEYLRECRTLERVELYDCQQISRSAICKFKQYLPNVMIHAYFAPATPPAIPNPTRRRYCRCCIIL